MTAVKVNRKRDKAVTVRMSEREYELLQKRVEESGLSQQAFIISAIKGTVISSSDEIAVLKSINRSFEFLNSQLRGLATNVNQMAHIANGHGYLFTLQELEKIYEEISDFRRECEELWRSIRSSINQPNRTGL